MGCTPDLENDDTYVFTQSLWSCVISLLLLLSYKRLRSGTLHVRKTIVTNEKRIKRFGLKLGFKFSKHCLNFEMITVDKEPESKL